eukprot:g4558.t1
MSLSRRKRRIAFLTLPCFVSETTKKKQFVDLEDSPVKSGVIRDTKQEAVVPSQEITSEKRVTDGSSKSPESLSPRKNTRRIFVAKIPSHVSEEDMRKYFESFGEIEDAYRPKDFTKNTLRGIGFITFVHTSTTEKVMEQKHKLGGVEVVIDRATPKNSSATLSKTSGSSNVDELNSANSTIGSLQATLDWLQKSDEDYCYCYGSLNEDIGADLTAYRKLKSSAGSCAASTATTRAPSTILSDDLNDFSLTTGYDSSGNPSQIRPGKSSRNLKQTGTDNLSLVRKLRGGPRIFVGKLTKDTVEQDLADYFSKFGFVMDVYIPRSKENKKEHRGFGFVTFETDASIERTVAQGTHTLKGAVLAIDVAVPENAKTLNKTINS